MRNKTKRQSRHCEGCILRESSFPVEALDAQSSLCNQIKHSIRAPKTVIYQQGDLPQSVFSLRRGFVKLTQLSKEGEEKIVRILGPGYTLGMESLSQQNYKQTAEALTEVDFCTIPAAMLIEMSNQQPLICHEIINQWQRQLEDADNWLSEFYAGTIIQRLCRFLLVQYDLQKMPDKQLLLISNQDIASILATCDEAISRALSFLRSEGVLQQVDKRIYQLDLAAAEAIAKS